jgi:hypothetical protein
VKSSIQIDLTEVPSVIKTNHLLAITCLDQVGDQITFVEDDVIYEKSTEFIFEKPC